MGTRFPPVKRLPPGRRDNQLAAAVERGKNGDVQFPALLLPLAAPPSAGDRIQVIPGQVWINLAICIVAVIFLIRLWRGMKQVNDYLPYFAAAFASFMILFFWVYNRSEPRFLTPVVEKLTYFFPTKSKSEQDLEKMRRSRE